MGVPTGKPAKSTPSPLSPPFPPAETGFSRTPRAAVATSRSMQDAGAQELEPGSAVHGAFDHLDAADLALRRAGGPGQRERGFHGTDVLAQLGHEAGQLCARRGSENVCEHLDRKSTRLNSSHANISYAVFCLKKKKQKTQKRDIHDNQSHN